MYQVIQIHPEAPAQPVEGAACNGCGVCCASEPCPLGALASGRRHGACAALVWNEDSANYRCGLIEQPSAHLPAGLRWGAPLLARLARRSIASGIGCDAGASVEGRGERRARHVDEPVDDHIDARIDEHIDRVGYIDARVDQRIGDGAEARAENPAEGR